MMSRDERRAIDQWLLRRGTYTALTIAQYRSCINALSSALGARPLAATSRDEAVAFIQRYAGEDSRRRALAALRGCFAALARSGVQSRNPVENLAYADVRDDVPPESILNALDESGLSRRRAARVTWADIAALVFDGRRSRPRAPFASLLRTTYVGRRALAKLEHNAARPVFAACGTPRYAKLREPPPPPPLSPVTRR